MRLHPKIYENTIIYGNILKFMTVKLLSSFDICDRDYYSKRCLV